MRSRLKISRAGIELIESFEGLRRRAARLPDGRWTIGYGHTLSAREGAEVSAEDAEALLLFDLLPVVEAVNGLVFVELTQNQFDALCAFAFNVGVEAFRGSDVLKRVNEGRLTEAACAFDLWRKAEISGEEMVLDALIRRRAAEKALFLTPADGFVPTPTPLVRPAEDPGLAPTLPQRRPAQIETPLDGDEAVVRRVGPVDEPEPMDEQELAAVERSEPGAETLTVEPAEQTTEVEAAPEPAAEAPTTEAPAEQAVEQAEPVVVAVPEPRAAEPNHTAALWSAFEAQVAAAEAAEPGAEALEGELIEAPVEPVAEPTPVVIEAAPEPEAEPQAAAEPAPAAEVRPEPGAAAAAGAGPIATPAAQPEPAPAPATTVAAAAAMSARLFSPYGGGVSFGALPPRPVQAPPPVAEPPASTPVQTAFAPVEPQVQAPPEPQPQVEAPPAPTPAYAEAAPSKFEPPVRPEPAVAFEAGQVEAQPFTLTPPPEREPAFMPQASSVVWSQPAGDETDDETPLFEETWQEVRPAPRIIRHEPVQTDPMEEEVGPTAPFVLLGFIGLAAFGGAVAAFLKSKQVTATEPAILAWTLVLIAVACVSTSVYFLLKRLGGVRD